MSKESSFSTGFTERSLYTPIIGFLESQFKIKAVSEAKTIEGRGYIDILCETGYGQRVVIEIRFGSNKDQAKLIIDAIKHARELHTTNFAVMLYTKPESTLLPTDDIVEFALETPVICACSTEWWTENLQDRLKARIFLETLFSATSIKSRKAPISTVITSLKTEVNLISLALRRALGTENTVNLGISQVVGKFETFVSLSNRDRENPKIQTELRLAAIDLMAFILVNQIVFYRLYRERTKNDKEYGLSLPDLPAFDVDIDHLQLCISAISEINYDAIYGIDVLKVVKLIKKNESLVDEISTLVTLLPSLRPEEISHDLLGTMLHDLIPDTTRAILGAFFTSPEGGDILAACSLFNITKTKKDFKIMDPACGSGTLLVSAYRYIRRKQNPSDLPTFHRDMIGNRIIGIDVMPFAASMAATNLAAQQAEITLRSELIGMKDSLTIVDGSFVRSFSDALNSQLTQMGIEEYKDFSSSKRDPDNERKGFKIYPPDVVLMNPPFTSWEDLPEEFRDSINRRQDLVKIAGGKFNLWMLFIALAYNVLKEGGVLGLVVPIQLFQGRNTAALMKLMFLECTVKSIVINEKGMGFAASQQFRNVLLTLEKRKPTDSDEVTIIHLHMNLEAEGHRVEDLADRLSKTVWEDAEPPNNCILQKVKYNSKNFIEEIQKNINSSGQPSWVRLTKFLDEVYKKSEGKLKPIGNSIWEGYGPRPRGVSDVAFVRRNIPSQVNGISTRIKHASLILESEDKDSIKFYRKATSKDTNESKKYFSFNIEKQKVYPALFTISNIKSIDLNGYCDYLILDKYENFDTALALSGWRDRKRKGNSNIFTWDTLVESKAMRKKTYLAIPDTIMLDSPEIHLMAVARSEQFIISNILYGITCADSMEAKLQAMWLNSTPALAFYVINQTGGLGGGLSRLKIKTWSKFKLIDIQKLISTEKAAILRAWDDFSAFENKSLYTQLEERKQRMKFDKAILKIFGWSEEELESELPKIYDALKSEIVRPATRANRETRKKKSQKKLDSFLG